MKHPERIEQQKLVGFLREFYPDLLFWHTPNGEDRNGKVAIELSQMGVRPGVLDLFFPTLKHFIEMKRPGEADKLSAAQKYVRHILVLAGYTYASYDDARAAFADIEDRMRERGGFGFERQSGGLPRSGG